MLYTLATVPATSAASERVYSLAHNLITAKRSNIKMEKVITIKVLKLNFKLNPGLDLKHLIDYNSVTGWWVYLS